MSEKECCGTCRFGRVKPDNVKNVDCFRYPAQVTVVLVPHPQDPRQPVPMYLNGTPTMETDDWCGEWQEKKSKLVAA